MKLLKVTLIWFYFILALLITSSNVSADNSTNCSANGFLCSSKEYKCTNENSVIQNKDNNVVVKRCESNETCFETGGNLSCVKVDDNYCRQFSDSSSSCASARGDCRWYQGNPQYDQPRYSCRSNVLGNLEQRCGNEGYCYNAQECFMGFDGLSYCANKNSIPNGSYCNKNSEQVECSQDIVGGQSCYNNRCTACDPGKNGGILGVVCNQTSSTNPGNSQTATPTTKPSSSNNSPNQCTEYEEFNSRGVFYGECRPSCGNDRELTQYSASCAGSRGSDGFDEPYCCQTKSLSDGSRPEPKTTPGSSDAFTNPATPTKPGYCADANRKVESGQAPKVGPISSSCSIENTTWDGKTPNEYCKKATNGKYQYYYFCDDPGSSSGGVSGVTPTLTPPKFPANACSGDKGGVIGYLEPRCGETDAGKFNIDKAQRGEYYNEKYYDVYICKAKDANGKNILDPYLEPSGNVGGSEVCKKSPWTFTTPSGSPTPTDSPNCPTQGTTCEYDPSSDVAKQTGNCCASLNLYCKPVSGLKENQGVCQYKEVNGTPQVPTPTAGAAAKCTFGDMGVGCACGPGKNGNDSRFPGGCNSSNDCLPALNTDDKEYYCTTHGAVGGWCSTLNRMTTSTACLSTTPTATPTPVASLQCPNDGNHICATSTTCDGKAGYTQKAIGNAACAAYESKTPICCVKTASTGTAATATPIPASSAQTCSGALQCQAGIYGTETDDTKKCVDGWSSVGKRDCTLNTICCKQN